MYIHKLSDSQIKELMKCYASDYTDIDILRASDCIDVDLTIDNGVTERYVLYDFNVDVFDWDDSETDCLHDYRAKMLEYFGNQYAIDYLLG